MTRTDDIATDAAVGPVDAPAEDTTLPGWIIAAASALTALLTLLVARFTHPAVGPDAVSYLAVSNSIRTGGGIAFWLEDPLLTWPPLWPALIAGLTAVSRLDSDVAALVLNSLAAAACVPVGFAVARRVLGTRFTTRAMLISLAVSPVLVGLAVLVQTEVLFALVTLGVFYVLMRWIDDEAPKWLVIAGALCAVGFYVRYQAIYVVPVFGAWIGLRVLLRRRSSSGSALGAAIVAGLWYVVPAVVPPLLWIARNLSVGDSAMGPRFPSSIGPARNLAAAFSTTFKFLTSLPSVPLAPTALVTVVGLAVVVVTLERTTRPEGQSLRSSIVSRLLEGFQGPAGLLVVFVTGFTLLMVVTRSMIGFDDLDIRLLSPCLVPTSILLLRWSELVLFSAPRRQLLGRVVVGGWLGLQVVITLALVGPANSFMADYGFNADRAVAASTSPALDALPEDCVMYSNNAGDMYQSGFEAFLSPRKVEYKSDQPTNDLAELVAKVEAGETSCLVWVEYSVDEEYWSVDELREHLTLVELGSADDVTTYRLEPR